MATITAAMVKELRDKTSAGMMDCKTALNENNGDIEAAVDWLRKKGLAKAAKKAGRVAAEGLVALVVKGNKGAVIEVNSETDFVARNDQFQGFVREAVGLAAGGAATLDALEGAKTAAGSNVKDRLQELIATIGENMTLRRVDTIDVGQGAIGSYLHGSVGDSLGKIGVLVALETTGKADEAAAAARQIAMHIAASNPLALDASGIDPSVIEREKAILLEKNAGKPANVLEKIVENGLKTYFKEVTLLEQAFVHDPSKSVAQVVKELESKVGAPVKIKHYIRFALGEGIEKEEAQDFAAEVAAASGVKN